MRGGNLKAAESLGKPWERHACFPQQAPLPSRFVVCREEEATEVHGHITSLAVARTHRKLGLATKLMAAARGWGGVG